MVKGAIAVLDLPVGSALSMDGFSMILKRSDFVGISDIPTGDFHLVTVRRSGENTPSIILHGFVLYGDGEEWLLARKYNPTTEEVSVTELDELTVSNLHQQLQNHQIDHQRLIPYHKLIVTSQWKDSTNYISAALLRKRGFQHGDKILPGAYIGDETISEQPTSTILDGNSITYPAIPCIDQSISIHKTKHQGTKLYLSWLAPTDRSLIYLAVDPAQQALSSVLEREYNNKWETLLGDLQLAFVLFIHLHCYSSLEHWRDLIAMLSFVQTKGILKRHDMYVQLLEILRKQLLFVETDFFMDMEYSGDNFFVPSLQRLCLSCQDSNHSNLRTTATAFMKFARTKFATAFDTSNIDGNENPNISECLPETLGHDSDDEAPVIVPSEEIEASIARQQPIPLPKNSIGQYHPDAHKCRYPLLFASMQSHEDIMMTCARILDERIDVSVVREAAAYLEEVEATM